MRIGPVWSGTLITLGIMGGTIALIGWLAGTSTALGIAGLWLLWLWLRDRAQQNALWHWIDTGRARPLPPAHGLWDEMFARLYRQERAHARQHAMLSDALLGFRHAAQALPDGVVTLNSENQIVWGNATACEHLGLKLASDAGQNITNLLRAPDFLDYLGSNDWETPVKVRLRGGPASSGRLLSLRLVAYGEGQKLLLSRDVTSIERMETMRRDFVANVSHELKTPLTVLSGFLETIRDMPLNADQIAQFLDLMIEQAQRMERLVADLLTLSALEANAQPQDETVDMARLFDKIATTAQQLSGGQHRIDWSIAEGLNLCGSETEIASALSNLVTNAVRYTPPGGQVSVRWEAVPGDDGVSARISVRDSGIGIPAQHLPRLTERFYRVDRGRSRESGGTGLGLAIVKHALTRHQATLNIESSPGTGSCFSATFPPQRVLTPKI